jgi:hypothetical protein
LKEKGSGSGLESREYGRRDLSRRTRGTLYPQQLALTSPTSGGRSVGIVRSRTQATEFSFSHISEINIKICISLDIFPLNFQFHKWSLWCPMFPNLTLTAAYAILARR